MESEALAKMADVLAEATGFVEDTATPSGSEAQVTVSEIINGLADRLGDDGPAFLRMYARACEREDANPLVLNFDTRGDGTRGDGDVS